MQSIQIAFPPHTDTQIHIAIMCTFVCVRWMLRACIYVCVVCMCMYLVSLRYESERTNTFDCSFHCSQSTFSTINTKAQAKDNTAMTNDGRFNIFIKLNRIFTDKFFEYFTLKFLCKSSLLIG